ncbi:Uncharacterized protein OBRU01_24440 [Operophtera brumata]|uniref:C2H2-type domain-containing protein n=1 Tax=Operophtera brumata TaxID=104452 RepID=A0A0L7KC48_OPEBR|nr:Uncharacterized protein OBRU01_24440 [Operophtera brumata]
MDSNSKDHRCKICNKTFKSTYKLKAHLFYHKAVPGRFTCSLCLKEYYRKDEYKRHIAVHKNEQKLHVCDHCGRGFVDKRNLINHLYIHDDLYVPSKRYNCIVCDVSYCEERLLKYHIRKHHMNLDNNVPIYTNKNLNESWIEPAMDFQSCVQITKVKNNMLSIKKCKIKIKNESDKALHNKIIQPSSIEQCKIKQVTKVEADKSALQSYLASVFALKDNLYSKAICDYCNKQMLKKSLIVHIRERHMKMRRFHCYICNSSFNRHYHLSDHICGKDINVP